MTRRVSRRRRQAELPSRFGRRSRRRGARTLAARRRRRRWPPGRPVLLPACRRLVVLLGQRLSALTGCRVDEEHRLRDSALRSMRLGGGRSLAKTAVPAVTSRTARSCDLLGVLVMDRLAHRADPAPSDTTALKSSVSAAAWSIISPPTESPTPPMRSGSTSGRLEVAIAASRSRVLSSRGRSGRRRSRPRRADRAEPVALAASSLPASAAPCGRGRRSPSRRSSRERASRGGAVRRSW